MKVAYTTVEVSPSAGRVFEVVRARARDGYAIMARTGLKVEEYSRAITELSHKNLVELESSSSTSSEIEGQFVYVPPSAMGAAIVVGGE